MYVPTVDQLRDQFENLAWGDRRSIAVARSVPADGFTAEQEYSLGSVHKLLVHMMAAQITWLGRWRGAGPTRMEDTSDHPTLAAVEGRWPAVHADLLAFVGAQRPRPCPGRCRTATPAAIRSPWPWDRRCSMWPTTPPTTAAN